MTFDRRRGTFSGVKPTTDRLPPRSSSVKASTCPAGVPLISKTRTHASGAPVSATKARTSLRTSRASRPLGVDRAVDPRGELGEPSSVHVEGDHARPDAAREVGAEASHAADPDEDRHVALGEAGTHDGLPGGRGRVGDGCELPGLEASAAEGSALSGRRVEGEQVVGGHHGVGCEPAVGVVARHTSVSAGRGATTPAGGAPAAGGHRRREHATTDQGLVGAGPDRDHPAHDLMPEDEGQGCTRRDLPVGEPQVRVTDARAGDLEEREAIRRHAPGPFPLHERPPGRLERPCESVDLHAHLPFALCPPTPGPTACERYSG